MYCVLLDAARESVTVVVAVISLFLSVTKP